jgi:hypothetical protein
LELPSRLRPTRESPRHRRCRTDHRSWMAFWTEWCSRMWFWAEEYWEDKMWTWNDAISTKKYLSSLSYDFESFLEEVDLYRYVLKTYVSFQRWSVHNTQWTHENASSSPPSSAPVAFEYLSLL